MLRVAPVIMNAVSYTELAVYKRQILPIHSGQKNADKVEALCRAALLNELSGQIRK